MSSRNNSGGITFAGALQIVFIVLKLTGIVEWNWIAVLAPTWIGLIVLIIMVILVMVKYR